MKKTVVIQALNELPKDFPLEDFIEKLIVVEKIDAGLEDIKEGRTITHEKMKKDIRKWLK